MRKNGKKWLSLVLAAVMTAGTLAGCGSGAGDKQQEPQGSSAGEQTEEKSSEQSEQAEESSEASAEADSQEERPTFKIVTVRWDGNWPTDFLSEGFMKEMEEEAGIHIEWEIYSYGDWSEQRSLLLASEDLPDAFLGSITLNASDIAMNREYFVDLTEKIADMPNLTKAMEADPVLRAICTDRDGRIYSLPKRLAMRPKVNGDMAYINRDWLDRLNLEAPTTIDELTNVLLKFKEEDADGDGDPNNEFPLTGDSGAPLFDDLRHVLSPFGTMVSRDGNWMGLNNDGEPVFVPVQENYKEAVKWMRSLWEQGIVDPERFTQDGSTRQAKQQAQDGSQVGMIFGWTCDAEAGMNAGQFEVLEAVEGWNGIHYLESATDYLDVTDRELVITKNCEDPDALLRWADSFYTDLASLQMTYGEIGVAITDNGDGTYSVDRPTDGTSMDTFAWCHSLRDFGPKYMSPDFEKNVILPVEEGDGVKRAEDAVNEQYVTLDRNVGMPMVHYTDEELERLTTLSSDISPYVNAQYSHWVVDGGIEEEWDAYIQKLKEMGLDEYVEIQKAAFAAYKESMK